MFLIFPVFLAIHWNARITASPSSSAQRYNENFTMRASRLSAPRRSTMYGTENLVVPKYMDTQFETTTRSNPTFASSTTIHDFIYPDFSSSSNVDLMHPDLLLRPRTKCTDPQDILHLRIAHK